MARRCTTVPGFGACCQAAQQNRLGQPIRIQTSHGQRCAICTPITRRNGRPGFQFRFQHSSACGITSGCPMLGTGTQGAVQLLQ
jgi:hypothetical protein